MNGIRLWVWLKVRYKSTDKLEPLCSLYKEDMRLLNLKFNELLVSFVDWLQGLEILQ